MEASEHVWMQISEGPDMTIGDVCMGCSDPAIGKWVPVSFCDISKANMESYYTYESV